MSEAERIAGQIWVARARNVRQEQSRFECFVWALAGERRSLARFRKKMTHWMQRGIRVRNRAKAA